MKTLKLLSILVLAGYCLPAQNFELSTDFNFSQPVGMMSRNMNNAFGLSFDIAHRFKAPFSLGLELGLGNYGYQTTRQEYTFDDGSVTETDVNVSNNLFSLVFTGKHFLRPLKKVNPYLSGKAGWTWFTTNLTIEDPEDESSCHPLESDILSRDATYTFSGGAGVRVDLNAVFKNTPEGKLYLDMSVHGTYGGIVRYMNVEMNPSLSPPDQDVMAKFINTNTQVIHEHHVGYVYTSVLNMVEYRLGMVFRLGTQ